MGAAPERLRGGPHPGPPGVAGPGRPHRCRGRGRGGGGGRRQRPVGRTAGTVESVAARISPVPRRVPDLTEPDGLASLVTRRRVTVAVPGEAAGRRSTGDRPPSDVARHGDRIARSPVSGRRTAIAHSAGEPLNGPSEAGPAARRPTVSRVRVLPVRRSRSRRRQGPPRLGGVRRRQRDPRRLVALIEGECPARQPRVIRRPGASAATGSTALGRSGDGRRRGGR